MQVISRDIFSEFVSTINGVINSVKDNKDKLRDSVVNVSLLILSLEEKLAETPSDTQDNMILRTIYTMNLAQAKMIRDNDLRLIRNIENTLDRLI